MDRIGIGVMYWRRCKHFKCSNRKLNKISIHRINQSITPLLPSTTPSTTTATPIPTPAIRYYSPTLLLRPLSLNLMNPHIHPNPESSPPPLNPHAPPNSPRPNRQGQHIPPQPRKQPLSEWASRNTATGTWWWAHEQRGMLIDFERGARVQEDVQRPVHRAPDHHAQQPYNHKSSPGIWDAEMLVEPGQSSKPDRPVRATQEGLRPWLHERSQRDRELAHTEPADPPSDIGRERHVGHGLDGEVAEEEGVVSYS